MSIEVVKFMEDYCKFDENRVYILMGIARKKYNPGLSHNTEIVYRKIVKDKEDIQWKYNEIMGMMENKDKNFYLYLSVNARNVIKGFFNYQSRMGDWVKHRMMGDKNQDRKFKKIDSNWYSELQRPHNSDDSYFLIDIDNKADHKIERILNHHRTVSTVKAKRETPHGYHIVTEPYNYRKERIAHKNLHENFDIKKDDNLFLKYFGDRNAL